MVVVMIIGILLAVAFPTFLGAQRRAQDRVAQSDLRNAVTAVRAFTTDYDGLFRNSHVPCFGDAAPNEVTATDLAATAPEKVFAPGAISTANGTNLTFDITDSCSLILLGRLSASGRYFGVLLAIDGDVGYCGGSDPAILTKATCLNKAW